ncbi:MAG: transporter related [Hyphomicrobiales bacterium]|nr:transporter related [Hyphomicrobiales bacterium]
MMPAALLDVRSVTQRFGGFTALDDVSCSIQAGSISSLIGPNGAGKTTLFNVISGLIAPSAGSLGFNGADYTGRRPDEIVRLGIARNFQQVRLFPALSVIENVMVGAHQKLPRTGILDFLGGPFSYDRVDRLARSIATEMLDLVEFRSAGNTHPQQLTLVDQRRVEIARALASDPKLLLLDEPAAGMNPSESNQLGAIIRKIRDLGRTVLLVEHNMRLVMTISDHVSVLSAGRVIATGTPSTVQADPTVIAAYLGNV